MLFLLCDFLPHLENFHVHLRMFGHLGTSAKELRNLLFFLIRLAAIQQNLICVSFLIHHSSSLVIFPLDSAAKLLLRCSRSARQLELQLSVLKSDDSVVSRAAHGSFWLQGVAHLLLPRVLTFDEQVLLHQVILDHHVLCDSSRNLDRRDFLHLSLQLLFLPLLMQLHGHPVLFKFLCSNLFVPSNPVLSGLLPTIIALLNDLKHSWVAGVHFETSTDDVLL